MALVLLSIFGNLPKPGTFMNGGFGFRLYQSLYLRIIIIMILPRFILAAVLLNFLIHLAAAAGKGGFSVEVVRRGLAGSPRSKGSTQLGEQAYKAQHLLKLPLGTPPVNVFGVLDTGSDLIWTQCAPCPNCYTQINALFDPKKSSTYSDVSCQTDQCKILDTKCTDNNLCSYMYGYGDASYTQGTLGKETITLGGTALEVYFGCGHNDTGTFNDHEMGIIGLGGGPLSLTSQIASSVGGKKFSHCLLPDGADESISSTVRFGAGSEVLGEGVVTTPLIPRPDGNLYFVTLKGISVGDKLIPYDPSGAAAEGNIFLDSGTPPFLVQKQFYDRLVAEVKNAIPTPAADDPDLGTQLCYKADANLDAAIMTAHFDGADVKLTRPQVFIPPPKEGYVCLAIQSTDDGFGLFGNFAQSNLLIGIDTEKNTVSFKPMDCSKY